MAETVEQIEASLKERSSALSAGMTANMFPSDMPAFYRSELAIRLLLANLVTAPVEVFERARREHQVLAHDGQHGGDDCEACGYVDAAVYQAKNPGRQLSRDFIGAK